MFLTNAKCEYSKDWITCREPKWFPCFSLADIVTMQGERFYMPPQVSVADVIEYNMKYMIENDDSQVQECNQRLREVYE